MIQYIKKQLIIIGCAVLAIVLIVSSIFNFARNSQYEQTTFSDFMLAMEEGNLAEVEIRYDRIIYMTKEEAADAACKAVRDLAIEVGIPQHLTEIGIKEEDIPALAEQAITDVCTPGNPREVTKEDIIELYKKIL